MEASAIPASVGLARTRIVIGASLLRFRTDEQLVTLFREGNDEAFRVIHDRYRARMFAYARQMLGSSGQDPEDAVQEIFMRAYHGLRANDRELALRAWLYRIAHNRCIDDLRRPQTVALTVTESVGAGPQDPAAKAEARDALRRLIADVQRLPDQQRSALLMRELSGMSYADVSAALGVTVPAVKSLLVRARIGLAQASEARNTACSEIRADLILAHDRGVRTSGLARRHLRECSSCRAFRTEVRGVSRQLAALAPTLGPLGVLAHLLGWGGGGSAASGGAVGGGGAAAGAGSAAGAGTAAAGTTALAAGGAATSTGLIVGGSHVVTLLAAAAVTAGGAVAVQSSIVHHPRRAPLVAHAHALTAPVAGGAAPATVAAASATLGSGSAAAAAGPAGGAAGAATGSTGPASATSASPAGPAGTQRTPISQLLDPDMYSPNNLPPSTSLPADPNAPAGAATGTSTPTSTTGAPTDGSSATGSSSPSSADSTAGSTGAPAATGSTGSTTATGSTGATGSTAGGSTATGTASGSGTSASTSTGTGSTSSSTTVGQSTHSTASGSVVSFIKRRRSRHHVLLDGLLPR